MNDEQRAKVGVGVMIFKDGKVLLGQRKGAHGSGEFAPPGGHLEYAESFEQTARREVLEESGLTIKNLKFICLSNQLDYLPLHFVNLGFAADWASGDPEVKEPNKVVSWDWYELDKLPQPLYAMVPRYLEAIKTGKNFFDA